MAERGMPRMHYTIEPEGTKVVAQVGAGFLSVQRSLAVARETVWCHSERSGEGKRHHPDSPRAAPGMTRRPNPFTAASASSGGGISGIALAAHLDGDVDVLEKRARIGGLCGSIIDQGFTFDAAGPHIMFSKNKDVLNLMVSVLGDNVHQRRRDNKIWFKGRMVKYPFENDLAALAKEDTFECLLGYVNNPRAGDTPANLADWSYKTFGAGISDKYFIPYNRKIWNYDPEKIGLEFVSRIPKPPMEDVVKSAIGIPTEGYLHQLHFYYPIEGGYESVVHAFAKRVKGTIKTSWTVAEIEYADEHWHVRSTRRAKSASITSSCRRFRFTSCCRCGPVRLRKFAPPPDAFATTR